MPEDGPTNGRGSNRREEPDDTDRLDVILDASWIKHGVIEAEGGRRG